MTDEMLMRTAQLTPEYRPLVDFHSQYSTVQSQKGWRYGYTDASRPMERNTTFHEMVWHPHKNGHLADGRWQATEVGLHRRSRRSRHIHSFANASWLTRQRASSCRNAAPSGGPDHASCFCSARQE
jgi:hypothetical protein